MSGESPKSRLAIIADDEDLGRVLLGEAVTAVGLESLAFDNGADALYAALNHDVSIVLLDVDMPALNGNEVCRRLRADPRLGSVPIVIVTGHQDSAAIRRAFEAGATDFVSKPVNWALLPHRLKYILRNAAAAEQIEQEMYDLMELEVSTTQIGDRVMEELLKLDAVAFVRFASVYREFDSPQEFAKVVAAIKRSKHDVRNLGVAASIVKQLA